MPVRKLLKYKVYTCIQEKEERRCVLKWFSEDTPG